MKPPKNLLSTKDGADGRKTAGRGFGGDSFRNYMARKIELQRNQFGLILPPDPRTTSPDPRKSTPEPQKSTPIPRKLFPNPRKRVASSTAEPRTEETSKKRRSTKVRFSDDIQIFRIPGLKNPRKLKPRNRKPRPVKPIRLRENGGPLNVLERLQQKHERETSCDDTESSRKHAAPDEKEPIDYFACGAGADASEKPGDSEEAAHKEMEDSIDGGVEDGLNDDQGNEQETVATSPERRSDLFFYGVVVLVNGYTEPDAGEIQRLIHRHGGDLEKYETGRVTHIIAEHLSTAKANIYKRQRRPTPVCRPQWIVDSVKAFRLLPYADYLLDEVRDDNIGKKTVKSFFTSPAMKQRENGTKLDTLKEDEMKVRSIGDREGCLSDFTEKDTTDKEKVQLPRVRKEGSLPFEGPSYPELIMEAGSATPHACPATVESVAGPETVNETPPARSPKKRSETKDKSPIKPDGVTLAGRVRTVGTDPHFLDSYFHSSRLSFIGSFKQRSKQSPTKKMSKANEKTDSADRFVFHVDMDCFFASVVLRNFPEYRDRPVAISHNSGTAQTSSKRSTSECATCNYEARKYGITKGMYLGSARELCPDLIVLDYDFEGYEEVAEQVADILHRHAEPYNGGVEQVSCDEAYMEMFIPSTSEGSCPAVIAGDLAENIRREIFSATQCTASIGVAKNKLLAKLATDRVKPDKSMVVQNYREIIEPLKLRDLPGIGYKKERELTSEGLVTVRDIWDLGDEAEKELVRILGKVTGKKMSLFCKGIDNSPIHPAKRKSIGAECNYGIRFDGPYGVDHMMSGLAKEVQKRMELVGVRGSRITLKVKQRKEGAKPPPKFLGHGSCHNHSKSSDTKVTNDWEVFARIGMELFEQLGIPEDDVRGMGLVVTKLDNEASIGAGSSTSGSIRNFFASGKPAGTDDAMMSATHSSPKSRQNDTYRNDWDSGSTETKNQDPGRGRRMREEVVTTVAPKGKDSTLSWQSVSSPLSVAGLSEAESTRSRIDERVLNELPSHIRDEIEMEIERADYNEQSNESVLVDNFSLVEAMPSYCSENGSVAEAIHKECQNGCSMQDSPVTPDVHGSVCEHDMDFELPPLSQIDMSQVMELPTPLRDQVVTRIQLSPQNKGSCAKSSDIEIHPRSSLEIVETAQSKTRPPNETRTPVGKAIGVPDDGCSHFRQVSVKRMLKLASVKNGEESLKDSLGESVSLTQLECLPLEMQLQIANNDDCRIGLLSPSRRRGRVAKKIDLSEEIVDEEGYSTSSECEVLPDAESKVEEKSEECVTLHVAQHTMAEEGHSSQDFYEEHILPLHEWMDSHQPDVEEITRMKEFLCLVVSENRIGDATKMLKSIRNRKDEWSDRHIYRAELLKAVEKKYREVPFGGSLDTKWLRLI